MKAWLWEISIYVVWGTFIFLLAFGPMIVDYRACTSFKEFTYDWTPFPHCNFHFDDALSAKAPQ